MGVLCWDENRDFVSARKRVIIIVFEEVMPRHVGESRTPTCSTARVRAVAFDITSKSSRSWLKLQVIASSVLCTSAKPATSRSALAAASSAYLKNGCLQGASSGRGGHQVLLGMLRG
eukprot:SAG11_NODE_6054_length_1399_cov_1.293846_2_plen_117_part_00